MEPIIRWIVLHCQDNILFYRQFCNEPQVLKGSANALPVDGVWLLVCQIFSLQQNLAALWPHEAGNQIKQRCFPCTVATHQGINLLFLQRQ